MFENLRKLYAHYGGLTAAAKSWYFWIALFLSAASYRSILEFSWTSLTLEIMPSLTGFTVAAYAIIFAIIEPRKLRALMAPDTAGRSPIAAIAASIGHAVFVQLISIIIALSFHFINLNYPIAYIQKQFQTNANVAYVLIPLIVTLIKCITSTIGIICTYYGIFLVLAAILSIVRVQLILADASKPKLP